jgi:uncharacterized protein YoxC
MKKLFFLGAFLLGICSFKMPSLNEDMKSLTAENKALTHKVDSFCRAAQIQIKSRTVETDRLARSAKDPKTLLPVYQKDCEYFTSLLEEIEALRKSVDDQLELIKQEDKKINRDFSKTDSETADLLKKLAAMGMDNGASNDKLRDAEKDCKRLKKTSCKEFERLKKLAES